MDPDVATRKASHRSPILSLVDREHLKSTANIPRSAWEPIAYLYSEADESRKRVLAMAVPEDLEWVRASCLKDWDQVTAWLDEILIDSQSIEALRSWQLMTGLQPQGNNGQRPSSAVMPEFNQPVPPGQEQPRKRMLRNGAT